MRRKVVGVETNYTLYLGEDFKLKTRNLRKGFAAKLDGHIPPTFWWQSHG